MPTDKIYLTTNQLHAITGWDYCGDAAGGVTVWLRGMPRGTVLGTDGGVGVELGTLDADQLHQACTIAAVPDEPDVMTAAEGRPMTTTRTG